MENKINKMKKTFEYMNVIRDEGCTTTIKRTSIPYIIIGATGPEKKYVSKNEWLSNLLGREINQKHGSSSLLKMALGVILLPMLFLLSMKYSILEAFLTILPYIGLAILIGSAIGIVAYFMFKANEQIKEHDLYILAYFIIHSSAIVLVGAIWVIIIVVGMIFTSLFEGKDSPNYCSYCGNDIRYESEECPYCGELI